MTRNEKRAFWIGFLFALSLCVVVLASHDKAVGRAHDAEIAQLDSIIARRGRANAALLVRLKEIQRTADSLRAQADRAGQRVVKKALTFAISTELPAVALTPTSDTTKMGAITRRSDGVTFPVPLFFIEAYQAGVDAYLAEQTLRVYTETYVVPLKDELITNLANDRKDALALASRWQAKANPRCSRKCTAVVTVAATIGAAAGLSKVQRVLRGS
jgi:hypothetical protein